MTIDELIRTIDIGDDSRRFKILFEMMISIESTNQTIVDLLISERANGDGVLKKEIYEEFGRIQNRSRVKIIQGLYERFGSLPGGLLSDNHE